MRPKHPSSLLPVAIMLAAMAVMLTTSAWAAPKYRVLHAFGAGNDGAGVWDSVTIDASENVYGTTSGRGAYGGGTVFRLTPRSGGHWSETILHNFGLQNDGAGPLGGVLIGPSGALFGTTQTGGGSRTAGIVYSLSPRNGKWREEVLHRFSFGDRAGNSWGNLVMDQQRNLYGTGASAFELSPSPKGWIEAVLHEFIGKNNDGSGAFAGPIRDAAANLYGTTMHGGGSNECGDGCGTVWELEPPASDDDSGGKAWNEIILHRFGFASDDGVFPALGQLAMDGEGNIYGAADGGKLPGGVIFKLTQVADGSSVASRETILYNFTGGADGNHPGGGVILDGAGNLYGTTIAGGGTGNGVVFKLSPQADGSWKYTLLHTFIGTDGFQPDANLTLGPGGKLYGTTATGGAHGGGVVFQLTP
jgi:uncharacterized repeat protein (TIGR03803 family)